MAIHSCILAWKIPWTEEPGGLHTVPGVTRVKCDLATKSPPLLIMVSVIVVLTKKMRY